MMKGKSVTNSIIALFFSVILAFLLLPTISAKAAVGVAISPSDFNDGLSNWSNIKNNSHGELPIGGVTKLGYAFGLAQNQSGLVSDMGDNTIINDSIANSTNNIYYSKMNIFLNDGGNYVSSVFQTGYKSNSTNAEQVSMTSPDFLFAPSDSTKSINAKDFSILGAGTKSNNNGNPGLTNKKFYSTTDANGHKCYKIIGNFVRTQGSAKNSEYDLEAEILLRPLPSNSAIIQRELYLKNRSNTTQKFTILFGEDTKIGDSNGGNDMVPIYDLKNKDGINIQTMYNNHWMRLIVTNQTPDGFDNYAAEENSTSGTGMNWASGFTPATVSGTGNELKDYSSNNYMIKNNVDTAYSLKWNPTTLAPGETSHYGSTMGVTAKPYSIPTANKTYTNLSRTGSVNKVGDKLKFTLKMTNNVFGAQWNYKDLTDAIPKGLQLDTSSIKESFNGGTFQIPASNKYNYDSSSRTLTVTPEQALTDEQYETVTYEATIENDALQNLDANNELTNTAKFNGSDYNVSPNQVDTYEASVKFPVSPPDFRYNFTKQVKNITNGETSFNDSTSAKKGDIVDYFIKFEVDSNSTDTMDTGSKFTDTLEPGLEQYVQFTSKVPVTANHTRMELILILLLQKLAKDKV